MPALKLKLKVDEFDRLTTMRGLQNDADRARAIGVQPSTVRRIRHGQIKPGERFVGLTLAYLEVPFEWLFEIEGRS